MPLTDVFDFEQIRSACGGKWLQKAERAPHIIGVGIDSREDLTDKLFIAIKGDTHDGHDHLVQAVERGARLLIVERERLPALKLPPDVYAMYVASTRKALGRIAHAYRQSLRGTKVIAVTGSSGKTTTKRLIHGILSANMSGSASPKSFNNDIGVPLTLMAAKSSDKYVVVEVGTNAPGEIADLAEIAQPDIAVITMIGRSHLAGLGSIEGVAREKSALLAALSRDDGVAVLNADCPLLPRPKRVKMTILFGESAEADLRLTGRGAVNGTDHWFMEVNGRTRFDIALPGKHNAINALAAIAVARRMGLDDDRIRAGLITVRPEAMRMMPQVVGAASRAAGITFYNDAYNANPDSMAAALDTFSELAKDARRRIVILGDMLELGADSPELHREIGRHVLKIDHTSSVEHAVLIGEHMVHAAKVLGAEWKRDRISTFASLTDRAIAAIRKMLMPGDAVLVKASRGMGLERVIAACENAAQQQQPARRKPPSKPSSSRSTRKTRQPA